MHTVGRAKRVRRRRKESERRTRVWPRVWPEEGRQRSQGRRNKPPSNKINAREREGRERERERERERGRGEMKGWRQRG